MVVNSNLTSIKVLILYVHVLRLMSAVKYENFTFFKFGSQIHSTGNQNWGLAHSVKRRRGYMDGEPINKTMVMKIMRLFVHCDGVG